MAVPAAPNVLAVLPGWMPSTLMDVVKPLLSLDRQGLIRFRVSLEPYLLRSQLKSADLVVFCRNIEPRRPDVLAWVQAGAIPFIYDIDDNLFDVPEDMGDGPYYRAPGRIEQLNRYLQAAALVRVYSPVLLERIRPLNPAVRLVTPPLDWSLVSTGRQSERSLRGPVKIVYATSRRDDTLYQIFAPALRRILEEYPGQVEMHFWGVAPEEFRGSESVFFRKFTLNYDQYLRRFSQHGFDIGLAPLLDDVFHQSKTNNKFREYGACGIAGIYSDVSVYTGSVVDGKAGLLVKNNAEVWYSAMKRLIEDEGLRCRLGEAARRYLLEAYPQPAFAEEWLRQIHQVLSGAKLRSDRSRASTPGRIDGPLPGMTKIRQQVQLLATQPSVFANNAGKHLLNLSWLLRLNLLKRL
jgi:glycosyltransferase involved in cell wall biosynthesis